MRPAAIIHVGTSTPNLLVSAAAFVDGVAGAELGALEASPLDPPPAGASSAALPGSGVVPLGADGIMAFEEGRGRGGDPPFHVEAPGFGSGLDPPNTGRSFAAAAVNALATFGRRDVDVES